MTSIMATSHTPTTEKDISSSAFWSKPFAERDETFSWLRKNAPVSWHPPLEDQRVPPELHKEAGFWAVTRLSDIQHVSQNNEIFSSQQGTVMVRPLHPDTVLVPNFLEMDPPLHTQYRQMMSAAFTPKAVARLSAKIEERAHDIVAAVAGVGRIDLVDEVSGKLPMLTLADMLGLDGDAAGEFARAADNFVGASDPEVVPDGRDPVEFMIEQLGVMSKVGLDLVHYRREHPAEDIATAIAQGRIDGERLTDDQIGSIMLLLSVAGNDTTKQTTTWAVLELDRNRDQRQWLYEDFNARIAGATEEFVRYASPVIEFARIATEDTELGGQQISRGDKIGIFYCSGNRDESVFEHPEKLDLRRPRTPHVGFGGGGVHYCLGNGLAKAQLRAILNEIRLQLPNLAVVGEPELLNSEFINGIRHLPVDTH